MRRFIPYESCGMEIEISALLEDFPPSLGELCPHRPFLSALGLRRAGAFGRLPADRGGTMRPAVVVHRWAARLTVAACGCALLLPGLGATRVLTYHEVCFAQPAREMLASGRWLVPEIAGVVFPDKPPLAHWTAAA